MKLKTPVLSEPTVCEDAVFALYAAGAMALSAAGTLVVFSLVEPLDLGLGGVWAGLALLQLGRLVTLAWRYQQTDGPLPMLTSLSQVTASPEAPDVRAMQSMDVDRTDD